MKSFPKLFFIFAMILSPVVSHAAPGGALLKEEARAVGRALGRAEQTEARSVLRRAAAGGNIYRRMDEEKKSSWQGKMLIGLIVGGILWAISKMVEGAKPHPGSKPTPSAGRPAPQSATPPPLPQNPRQGPPPLPPQYPS